MTRPCRWHGGVAAARGSFGQRLAAPVFLGPAVAEEGAVLGVGDVAIGVAHPGADGANTVAVNHFAGVAMLPVL